MKFFIVQATLFFVSTSILLVGCSGCSVKTEQPLEQVDTSTDSTQDSAQTPKIKNEPERLIPTYKYPYEKLLAPDPEVLALFVEIREAFETDFAFSDLSGHERYRHALDELLESNPDDYATMLFWARRSKSKGKGESDEDYKSKRLSVLRKLYEMNSDKPHPEVLFYLASLSDSAKDSIEYAERANKKYPGGWWDIHSTLLARSFYYSGEYEKAYAEYQRIYKVLGEKLPGLDLSNMDKLRNRLNATNTNGE